MEVFVVVGLVGLAIVAVSVLFGDILDGVFEFEHFEFADGVLSTPVVGAFLAAFGAGGAMLLYGTKASMAGAVAGAVASGVVLGGATLALVRTLMHTPTDATPRAADLVGAMGRVVTRIPAEGLGEVLVMASGQRLKLSARAQEPIPGGASIIVVDVLSPTAVVVTESDF